MGNYCCSEQNQKKTVRGKRDIKKKQSIRSPLQKLSYERGIAQLFHDQNAFKRERPQNSRKKIDGIEILSEIGRGGQASIFKVKTQKSFPVPQSPEKEQNFFAMKRIQKPNNQEQMKAVKSGNQILLSHDCPFIAKTYMSSENEEYIYEIMELAEGGDLSTFHERTMGKGDMFRKLGQYGIKIILAGIILALQWLHQRQLVYNDLKMENVLIDSEGYPLLCDFHLMSSQKQPSTLTCGTLTYLSPQFFNSKPTKAVDIWALGILVYNLAYEQFPYSPQEIEDIQFQQESKRRQNKYFLKTKKASKQLIDLINGLLRANPSERLGIRSMKDLKNHQFFKDLDWDKYVNKVLKNPIKDIIECFPLKAKRFSQMTQFNLAQSLKTLKCEGQRRTKCDQNVGSSRQY